MKNKFTNLADLIDYILDESDQNELILSFRRTEGGVDVVIRDDLSDIGYAKGNSTYEAVEEMVNQMQSFVDERMASR